MCGIAGVLMHMESDVELVVSEMVGMIRDRGLDDWGVWCDPSVGLGARPCSAAGHQPMHSELWRYVAPYWSAAAVARQAGQCDLTDSDGCGRVGPVIEWRSQRTNDCRCASRRTSLGRDRFFDRGGTYAGTLISSGQDLHDRFP